MIYEYQDLERMLRHEWWMNHGCTALVYGDDGEMQCGQCLTDFKRYLFEDLKLRVDALRMIAAFGTEEQKARPATFIGPGLYFSKATETH